MSRHLLLVLTILCLGFFPRVGESQSAAAGGSAAGALDKKVDAILSRAAATRQCNYAVAILEELITAEALSVQHKTRIERDLLKYRDYASKGLVRNGPAWISIEEANAKAKKADELIKRSIDFFRVGEFDMAVKNLEDASREDQRGVRADFILGLMHSPLGGKNSPRDAEGYFKKVIVRSPNTTSALNNLAITLVWKKDFKGAVQQWRKMHEIVPNSPFVLHNVAELLSQIENGRIRLAATERKDITRFQVELMAGNAKVPEGQPGWWYANLTLAQEEEARTDFDELAASVETNTGAGIVVSPGYLLTAEQVVDSASSITVGFGANGTDSKCDAEIAAVSAVHGLALLKLSSSDAPAMPVSMEMPVVDSSFTQISFPVQEFGDATLTSQPLSLDTPSKVLGLTQRITFRGTPNAGDLGGAVCDVSGTVVAMVTSAGPVPQGAISAVPMSEIIPFLEKRIPSYSRQTAQGSRTLDEVRQLATASIGKITVRKRFHNFGIGSSTEPEYTVDTTAMCCGGDGLIPCTEKGCHKGLVNQKVVVSSDNGITLKLRTTQTRFVQVECPTCDGDGQIDCQFGGPGHQ